MIKKNHVIENKYSVEYMVFDTWQDEVELVHGFSTKHGGVSSGEWASLNLGFNRGDEEACVKQNYRHMCQVLGVEEESLVLSKQIHETSICEVKQEDKGNGIHKPNKWASADGIYTKEKGITLVTHYADCVPLFFYAPTYHIIGMAHAGWRGTVEEIGVKMIRTWKEKYGIPYEAIQVAIGPSIGPCCFEVHSDVADIFIKKFKKADFVVENTRNGKYNINLWECNKQSLMKEGLASSQITCAHTCTCCEHDTYYSHRYTKGKRGTLGAFMALK